ncbi:hypothetical protein MNBD_NITROSPINAE04-1250, partial [hydrothermal vent metagenome]
GPSWEFYWPYFDYPIGGDAWTYPGVPLKMTVAMLGNMPNWAGALTILVFMGGGMVLPLALIRFSDSFKLAAMFKDYFRKLGIIRYCIIQVHVLLMLGMVGKVLLRLTFGYKYIFTTPWFNI